MGISVREEDGWVRNWGVRGYGVSHVIEVPWPELASVPNFGSAMPRKDLDHLLIKHAVTSGARLREGVTVLSLLFMRNQGELLECGHDTPLVAQPQKNSLSRRVSLLTVVASRHGLLWQLGGKRI